MGTYRLAARTSTNGFALIAVDVCDWSRFQGLQPAAILCNCSVTADHKRELSSMQVTSACGNVGCKAYSRTNKISKHVS